MEWQVHLKRNVAWSVLETLEHWAWQQVKSGRLSSCLVLAEPLPTYTCGRSASPRDLLFSRGQLQTLGVEVKTATRGGKWTYHGPGQIVAYPILRLTDHGYVRRAVLRYMNDLRQVVSKVIATYGLKVESRDRPFGLYGPKGKLASFGVALRDGVTTHGFALYIEPQGNSFAGIHPCGVAGERISSLWEEGVKTSWEDVANRLTDRVKKGFNSSKNSIPYLEVADNENGLLGMGRVTGE